MNLRYLAVLSAAGLCAMAATSAVADDRDDKASDCRGLPSHAALKAALEQARKEKNGGFNLEMWGTIVNRDGIVCAIAFTGKDRGAQWPGSRVISAQKANTANAFSLPGLALSTANLYSAVSPGGSLYGLQHSNPVNPEVAYRGKAANSTAVSMIRWGAGRSAGLISSAAGLRFITRAGRSSADWA